jgi:tyrosyl-tRNA synthetase
MRAGPLGSESQPKERLSAFTGGSGLTRVAGGMMRIRRLLVAAPVVRRLSGATALSTLERRGFVSAATQDADKVLGKATAVYAGYDPTADGLHVGSLVTLMALGHLQRHGHTPVVLVGGATALIGDPSGRDTERSLLGEATVRSNCEHVGRDALHVLSAVCDPAGPAPLLVNNADWFGNMSALQLLRDVGRHFRVSAMLGRESVHRRMESSEGISFTEFSYQLLQAHDFFHLHKARGVCVQLGGSDQWGNITAGIDYAKRQGVAQQLCGVTVPLIQTRDGAKLGKSAGNAIWLSESRTSNFDLFQYFIKTPSDDLVGLWMSLMTTLSMDEIAAAAARGEGHPQRVLARSVVELLRGPEAALAAEQASAALYYNDKAPDPETPNVTLPAGGPLGLLDVACRAGIAASKSEVRRLIEQGLFSLRGLCISSSTTDLTTGGLYVNGTRMSDVATILQPDNNGVLVMSAGKRRRLLIKFV